LTQWLYIQDYASMQTPVISKYNRLVSVFEQNLDDKQLVLLGGPLIYMVPCQNLDRTN